MYRGGFVGRTFFSAVIRKLAYVAVGAVFAFGAAQCAHAAQCVVLNGDGTLSGTADAPSACAGFVLATGAEFQAMQSVFWELSISDGVEIGRYILLAWAIAFGFRQLRHVVDRDADFEERA